MEENIESDSYVVHGDDRVVRVVYTEPHTSKRGAVLPPMPPPKPKPKSVVRQIEAYDKAVHGLEKRYNNAVAKANKAEYDKEVRIKAPSEHRHSWTIPVETISPENVFEKVIVNWLCACGEDELTFNQLPIKPDMTLIAEKPKKAARSRLKIDWTMMIMLIMVVSIILLSAFKPYSGFIGPLSLLLMSVCAYLAFEEIKKI